jgi:hypothetical protein
VKYQFGTTETPKGHAAVVLQEDGEPLMLASKPVDYEYQSLRLSRMLNATNHSPLAVRAVRALQRQGIVEPISLQESVQ